MRQPPGNADSWTTAGIPFARWVNMPSDRSAIRGHRPGDLIAAHKDVPAGRICGACPSSQHSQKRVPAPPT